MQTERVRSADGSVIVYDWQGSGPPVLLVHGAMGDRRISWTQLRPLLEDRLTVFAMDRRGHGDSDPYLVDHALEREFEDVRAVACAIGDRVGVFGHSYGALCVLGAALDATCIERVLVYDPAALGDGPHAPRAARMLEAAEAAERHLKASDTDGLLRAWLSALGEPGERIDEMALSSDWVRAADAAARSVVPETRAVYAHELGHDLFAALSVPLELIAGGHTFGALQAAVPHLTVRQLDAHGHDAHRTNPELIAAVMVDFFLGPGDQ